MVADTKKKYKKRRREDEKISARVDDIIFYALKKHGYSVLPVTDINMQKRGSFSNGPLLFSYCLLLYA